MTDINTKNIADFILGIKRVTRMSDGSTVVDNAFPDILRCVNYRKDEILRAWNWDWLRVSATLSLVAGQEDYDLPSITLFGTTQQEIDKVEVINSTDGDYLLETSIKEFYRKMNPDEASTASQEKARYFIPIGRDPDTGIKKIKVWPIPLTSYTTTIWGTVTMADFVEGDATDATPRTFLPMPNNVVDILNNFVLSDAYEMQGQMAEANAKLSIARKALSDMIGDNQSSPASDVTSPPTDYIVFKKRSRRAGKMV